MTIYGKDKQRVTVTLLLAYNIHELHMPKYGHYALI